MKVKYPELRHVNFENYLQEAERIKKALSTAETATFMITDYDEGNGNLSDEGISISRDEFRDCTSFLNSRIMRCLGDIVRSGIDPKSRRRSLELAPEAMCFSGNLLDDFARISKIDENDLE